MIRLMQCAVKLTVASVMTSIVYSSSGLRPVLSMCTSAMTVATALVCGWLSSSGSEMIEVENISIVKLNFVVVQAVRKVLLPGSVSMLCKRRLVSGGGLLKNSVMIITDIWTYIVSNRVRTVLKKSKDARPLCYVISEWWNLGVLLVLSVWSTVQRFAVSNGLISRKFASSVRFIVVSFEP